MILIRTNHSWLRVGRHKCRALVEAGRDRSEEARTAVAHSRRSGGQSTDGGLQGAPEPCASGSAPEGCD
jgi:hypothetical protein